MAKRIGIVLSGCGVFDGSEIHEAVLTLLAIHRAGAKAVCMAPNIEQHHVINHLTGQEVAGETRSVLVESARIAHGRIRDVATVIASEIDALIFPGGFGAAKNLCDYAFKEAGCEVQPHVAQLAREAYTVGKSIGLICIAPVLAAKLFSTKHSQLTIGTDNRIESQIEKMGTRHVHCPATGFVVDRERKLVSTPSYMLAGNIGEVAEGVDKLVDALLEMMD